MNGIVKNKKRLVTSQEIEQALKNADNKNVIRKVCSTYSNLLNKDELDTCGLHGLWNALGYHIDGMGKKFTSNLYDYVSWECQKMIKKIHNKHAYPAGDLFAYRNIADKSDKNEVIEFMKECVVSLPEEDKKLISMYYYDNMTFQQIGDLLGTTKEAARQRLKKSLDKLKRICMK